MAVDGVKKIGLLLAQKCALMVALDFELVQAECGMDGGEVGLERGRFQAN
jgi:hypothetical protein